MKRRDFLKGFFTIPALTFLKGEPLTQEPELTEETIKVEGHDTQTVDILPDKRVSLNYHVSDPHNYQWLQSGASLVYTGELTKPAR